ncbi:hypothetical protein ABW20_dc0103508 [Dactylellina cionopaga]|nr:hypothetical protein ABW20_dc0103508 [Dactylellina cionopaga]
MRPPLGLIWEVLLSVTSLYSNIFVIVDALDECGCRKDLLPRLFDFQAHTKAKLFATSRPIPDIITLFEKNKALQIQIYAQENDIREYLKSNLPVAPEIVEENPEVVLEIENKIIDSCNGMFLLAKLRVNFLRGATSLKQVRIALEATSNVSTADTDADHTVVYNDAYQKTMEMIKGQPYLSRQCAEQALSWATFQQRPLSILEFRYALAIEPNTKQFDKTNLSPIQVVINVCGGLIILDEAKNTWEISSRSSNKYISRILYIYIVGAIGATMLVIQELK